MTTPTPTALLGHGSTTTIITPDEQRELMARAIESWNLPAGARILVLAPDFTRFHSGAGELTSMLYQLVGDRVRVDVMPTLGTHMPMEREELETM